MRLENNPIITSDMLPENDGRNINGPSLIRAPDWLDNRLGAYYLYFAHHQGDYIRLAYADRIEGPWTVHAPGTLRLDEAPGCRGHVASPDMHVVEETKQIRMYFHCPTEGGQKTFIAHSTDGLSFEAGAHPVASFYLRAVKWRDEWIGMSKGGRLYRSNDGLVFRELPEPAFPMRDENANLPGSVRHVALRVRGDMLDVYYTRIGDAPEAIFLSRVDLSRPESEWTADPGVLILEPETEWEGADLRVSASKRGTARQRERALRDPALFEEGGRLFLFYSVAGEAGIAVAERR